MKWIENFTKQIKTEEVLEISFKVLFAIIIFIVSIFLIKLVRKIVRKSMNRMKAEKGVIQFVDSFLNAALWIVMVFMIASNFGVATASIVALLGSAGVAIGLAVQGSLSNLAGGVLILLLKPFKVGDYIIEKSGNLEGTVTEIQIFYTKLITPDEHVIILPNGNLANNSIVNVSTLSSRRLDIKVGIAYDADLKLAKEVLLKVLQEDTEVDKNKEMLVCVEELGESSVKLIVRCHVANKAYWDCRFRLMENCKYALDTAGIQIPFPQMDIHMK